MTKKTNDLLDQQLKAEDLLPNTASQTIDSISLSSLGSYMLFDDIDADSVKPACEFIIKSNFIFDKSSALTMFINSGGGSVYDGFALIDTMEMSNIPIQTVAVGCVASMASVIFLSGTKGKRIMTRNSYMMLHQYSDGQEGKYFELVAHREHQDDLHVRMVKHIMKRSKLKERQVRDMFLGKHDVWLSSKEALKYGLCDLVKDPWE